MTTSTKGLLRCAAVGCALALGSIQAAAVPSPRFTQEAIDAAAFRLRLTILSVPSMPAEGTRGSCRIRVAVTAVARQPAGAGLRAGDRIEVDVPCYTPGARLRSCAFSLAAEELTAGSVFEAAFEGTRRDLEMVRFSYRRAAPGS